MTERPIIMTSESVRAILDGRKTQTRRVIKPQPIGADYWTAYNEPPQSFYPNTYDAQPKRLACPYGVPGDRLWVKESWANNIPGCPNGLSYKADHIDPLGDGPAHPMKWKSPIFMPHWASRLTLEVISVRVERLQEISEDDAIAEGIERLFTAEQCNTIAALVGTKPEDHGYNNYLWDGLIGRGITAKQADNWPHQYSCYHAAIGSYSSLWEKINAKRGYPWSSNPWVWVIEFRKAVVMNSDKLKPCPFCGKQPQGNNWHTYGRNPKDEMRYFCATVGCPNALQKAMTQEEWNTRPLEDALQAQVDRLKEVVEMVVSYGEIWKAEESVSITEFEFVLFDAALHALEGGE